MIRVTSARTGLRVVGLSGGVFCNEIVTKRLSELLRAEGMTVLRHEVVPPNDGGISFGQAAVAAMKKNLAASPWLRMFQNAREWCENRWARCAAYRHLRRIRNRNVSSRSGTKTESTGPGS